MVNEKKAFPNVTGQTGMDLRDYFAAKAMQGLMARVEQGGFDFSRCPNDVKRVAMWAYDLADAMMEERNK